MAALTVLKNDALFVDLVSKSLAVGYPLIRRQTFEVVEDFIQNILKGKL